MLRNPIPPVILLLALVAVAAAYIVFQRSLVPRYTAARQVAAQRSVLRLGMRVHYDAGPVLEEEYEMADDDGLSRSSYRALGRSGLQISIQERPRKTLEAGPNVAYFFQEAVADGIWELRSKPPRGNRATQYETHVYQLTGAAHGSHQFTFTDPHYWATTGGHQFQITLDRKKPVPDFLQLKSTVLVEPRYQKLVDDFRSFGPASFQAKVAAARVRLGQPK